MSRILRAAAAALLLATPAHAHHGWGGTVEEGVKLAGPHATMKIKVGANLWDITMAPPARTERAGLTEGLIPVGASVLVRGNRNRDPNRYEMKVIMVRYGKRQFDVYPERE